MAGPIQPLRPYYGNITATPPLSYVQQMQGKLGLAQDGINGPLTQRAVGSQPIAPRYGSITATPPLSYIQRMQTQAGVTPDGINGPITQRAVGSMPIAPHYENINQPLPALQNGQGVLGRPALNYQGAPAAAAAPAGGAGGTNPLAGLFGRLKGAAASLKPDPLADPTTRNMDLLNAGLGVAGAVAFATAKKPEIRRPDIFQSVAPVQNYEADRQAGYNQIAQNASSAMNNVRSQLGGDWSAYASAGLGVQAQSNNAQQQVNGAIGQQKRQDNIQMAQQLTADKEFNYNTQRSFDEAQYNESQLAYKGQREQGTAMMQSSLNYLTQQNAADRAFAEKQKSAQQAITGTLMENQLRYAKSGTEVDDVLARNNQTRHYMSAEGQARYDFQPLQTTGFSSGIGKLPATARPLTYKPR